MTEKSIQTVENRSKLRCPVYKNCGKHMHVKYYDGSKWQNAIFHNAGSTDCRDSQLNKYHIIAQDLTKFFSENALKNGGKISSDKMLLAWMNTTGANTPLERDDASSNNYATTKDVFNVAKIDRLEKMIQTACQDNSPGGTDVTQEEQFAIMKALASWFTR